MREKNLKDLKQVDLLVIGGGINGTGIARDAAGRGLSVALCETGDLAEHTSSASTKLIHGGLRYLEYYDFKLVHHALQEREVLLRSAPHIIWPLRFVLPYHVGLRPRWLIRLGLFLYDRLGKRRMLPSSNGIDLGDHVAGTVLQETYRYGFEYSDCWVQDSRLVVLNARDAHKNGARILTRTRCTGLKRMGAQWEVEVEDVRTRSVHFVKARAIVNATGPWVSQTLGLNAAAGNQGSVRLVKGSHIVVKKLFDHPYAYIFQHADGRVLFAIPYEGDFTLLGTTDVEVTGDPEQAHISEQETDYICRAASDYFAKPLGPDDVVWSYSGVRPLFDDASQNASKVTRDYVLRLDEQAAPIVSVFGGKITTSRKLSEEVVDLLKQPLGITRDAWTGTAHLPGGDIPGADYTLFTNRSKERYSWLKETVLIDYARNYGTEMDTLLQGRSSMAELGEDFGGGLYEAEVEFLADFEWAETAEDILWRRSRKGLRVPAETKNRLQRWLDGRDSNLAA